MVRVVRFRIRQRKDEHAQIFALRVETTLRDALDLQVVPDSLLLKHVWGGLISLAKELFIRAPKTLDELFCMWDYFESNSRMLGSSKVQSPDELTNLRVEFDERNAELDPKKIKDCFKCGIVGHWAWQCQNKRNRGLKRLNKRKNKI